MATFHGHLNIAHERLELLIQFTMPAIMSWSELKR
uniref:BLTX772 n=1 Tax=Nephila pilipes TaxID=299642 RepID=A0A076L0X7_NEPPI|nr:BLTX772 [Nephila pilipes]